MPFPSRIFRQHFGLATARECSTRVRAVDDSLAHSLTQLTVAQKSCVYSKPRRSRGEVERDPRSWQNKETGLQGNWENREGRWRRRRRRRRASTTHEERLCMKERKVVLGRQVVVGRKRSKWEQGTIMIMKKKPEKTTTYKKRGGRWGVCVSEMNSLCRISLGWPLFNPLPRRFRPQCETWSCFMTLH